MTYFSGTQNDEYLFKCEIIFRTFDAEKLYFDIDEKPVKLNFDFLDTEADIMSSGNEIVQI